MSDIRSLPPRFRSEHSESSRILSAYSRMIALKKQQPACRERLRHLRLVKASSLSVVKSAVYRSYDAMSRITSEANVLGTFGYSYVDDVSGSSKGTLRLASISYPNRRATNFTWYGNTGDQRLQSINNLLPSGAPLSQFSYGYDSAGEIVHWGQQSANLSPRVQNLGYDLAGQLTSSQSGFGAAPPKYADQFNYSYDCASNRTAVQTSLTQTANITGSVTSGNTLTITVYDSGISGGSKPETYTVLSGDTLTSIAAGLAGVINGDSTLSALGISATSASTVVNVKSTSSNLTTYAKSTSGGATETVTLAQGTGITGYSYNDLNELTSTSGGGSARFLGTTNKPIVSATVNSTVRATLPSSTSFTANAALSTGSNASTVNIVDGNNNSVTNTYQVSVQGGPSATLTNDANGNMTSDGTNSYAWDAENRLIKITYPGTNNYSSFVYDGLGRNATIVETVSGSVTSTKQFVWCGGQRCEARDGSSGITAQYFSNGETITGTSYFYTRDNNLSVRDVTNSSGTTEAEYGYSPYGQVTLLQGSNLSDFQYAGYYTHQRSSLNLTRSRAYHAGTGRWINRDPMGEIGGINFYDYVSNNPVGWLDPDGTNALVGALAGAEAGAVLGPGGVVVGGIIGGLAGIGIAWGAGQIVGATINNMSSGGNTCNSRPHPKPEGVTPQDHDRCRAKCSGQFGQDYLNCYNDCLSGYGYKWDPLAQRWYPPYWVPPSQ